MMYWKYLKSVLRHKWFVLVECYKLGIPWLGFIHDWSKFLPSEFGPYARYFYGTWPEELPYDFILPVGRTKSSVRREFDVAWLHHQHRNKHHWQRWLMTLDSARSDGRVIPVDMPRKYRLEMVADWMGAGMAHGNPNTKEWYLKNRDNMQLSPYTRGYVEAKLDIDSGFACHRNPIA